MERHFELEQSETKAQATLVTILSLTQITELKLLLDIGRNGHNFYDFVLTLLLASISLEIFIGIVIIYIGNLNYYHATDCRIGSNDVTSDSSLPPTSSATSGYATMQRLSTSGECDFTTGSQQSHRITGIECCDRPLERHVTSTAEVERLDASIEMALIQIADSELKTSQVSSYVRVLEEALQKSPGNAGLREELARAKSDLSTTGREKEETEARRRATEAQLNRALVVRRRDEECAALEAFQRVCYWQRIATYALYVVMVMNIFVTTFGISGGSGSVFVTRPHHVVHSHVVVPLLLPPSSASSAFNTTKYH